MRVIVVGAGVAGLAAAAALTKAGHEVIVREAARRTGGRLRSARVHGTVVDMGAQYLTMRDDRFREALLPMVERGTLLRWAEAVPYREGGVVREAADRVERWVAPDGMEVVAEHLALGLDVRVASAVSDLGGLAADAVVVAVPRDEAVRLVGPLPAVAMEPCLAWAGGFGTEAPPTWPALFVNDDRRLQWLAVDSAKGRGPETVVVGHFRAGVRLDPSEAAAAVADVMAPWSAPLRWSVTRWWEAARIDGALDAGAIEVGPGLVVAGDWCAGSRVEGAFVSGLAAARTVDPAAA